jgi:EmrB/QacA subfamily drug resistance transporter
MNTDDPSGTTVRTGALLTTVFVAQFLVALDVSLVNIALPDMQRDLGFTDGGLQWVVSAYLLTFAGFMLLGGRLGDLWGRRRVVLIGLAVFALASLFGGLAWNSNVLVIARAAQGLAGALLAPAALALVTTVPEGRQRRRAMALWGGAGAGGGAVGVVLSGVLTDAFGWRAVLFVNVPIVAIGLATALRGFGVFVDNNDRPPLDIAGAVLATLGVASVVYAVTAAGDDGWAAMSTLASFVLAATLLAAFVAVESLVRMPLVPLSLFRDRNMLGADVFGFMLSAGQLAAFYFASLHIQNMWGVPANTAGLMFVPFCVFVGVGIALATKMTDAMSPRTTLAVLGLIGALGLALFSRMPADTAFWTAVFVPSIFGGIGIGGSMVALGAAATSGTDPDDAGVVSGVLNASRMLGGTIGLAVLVTVAASVTASSTAESARLAAGEGYSVGLLLGAVFLVIGSILVWVIIPRRRPIRVGAFHRGDSDDDTTVPVLPDRPRT